MTKSKSLYPWIAFTLASLFWGTSFFWIKIALRELTPFMVVSYRLLIGALGLILFLVATHQKFPNIKKLWPKLLLVSFTNSFIPFLLITWSETRIDSGLASVLNGTVPLFAVVIAHLFLIDDRMSWRKVTGLLLGFMGIVALFANESTFSVSRSHSFLGQIAVLAASFCYACSIVFVRRNLPNFPPIWLTTITITFGALFLWPFVGITGARYQIPSLPLTWIAVVWLGLLGTATAYSLFYYVVSHWGATRASLVNYVFPVVGLVLGNLLLGESIQLRTVFGAMLIFMGILFTKKG